MDPAVFLAVLLAAALHAGWNAILRVGDDRLAGVTVITLFSALAGALAVPFVGAPRPEAWPWLALSVILHTGYRFALARAYQAGELGQVYPLARGTAPLIVAGVGLAAVADPVSATGLAGIAIVSAGIVVMTFRGGTATAARLGIEAAGFALLTSLFIAGYTLADGLGGRAGGSAHAYAAWLFLLDGVAIWTIVGAMRGRRLLTATARHWQAGLAGGVMSALAYWIVIWAMTRAPIAAVAALRETSVLFAALISVFVLREAMTPWRGIGAALILAGVVLIRIA